MNEKQWTAVCRQVDNLWGTTHKWQTAREAAWQYARNLEYDAMTEAVQDFMLEGKQHAPSPSEVISRTRSRGGLIAGTFEPRESCRHATFAIVSYHDDGTAADGLCIQCRTDLTWAPGQQRSVGDTTPLASEPDLEVVAG